MRTNTKAIAITLSFFISPLVSYEARAAEALTKQEIYAKCYAKISDFPVETTSAEYKDVVDGKVKPVDACMKLLNKAMFKTVGTGLELPDKTDVVSKSILRNFNQFHLSWFTSLHSAALSDPTHMYIDNTEPGLFLTKALFGQKHYSSITTANDGGLRGIREVAAPKQSYVINNTNFDNTILMVIPMKSVAPVPALINNYFDMSTLPHKMPVGPLVGIQPAPVVEYTLPEFAARESLTEEQLSSVIRVGMKANLTKHFGGGILGSPALFLNNVEQYGGMDGGLKVHRRWANNIFYDLLCSTLPSLAEDYSEVEKEYKEFHAQKSLLPFRGAKTCLTCHTTIDNLAHAARNVHVRSLTNATFLGRFNDAKLTTKTIRSFFTIFDHQVVKEAIVPIDSDLLYMRRKPAGRVVYFDYDGKEVNEPVEGLQQYGEVLAKKDDIYACAAKRYYHFLTGVDVPLKKPPANDKFATYHRTKVVALGKALKTHGSLKQLIEDILNSPAFTARNPAEVGVK